MCISRCVARSDVRDRLERYIVGHCPRQEHWQRGRHYLLELFRSSKHFINILLRGSRSLGRDGDLLLGVRLFVFELSERIPFESISNVTSSNSARAAGGDRQFSKRDNMQVLLFSSAVPVAARTMHGRFSDSEGRWTS